MNWLRSAPARQILRPITPGHKPRRQLYFIGATPARAANNQPSADGCASLNLLDLNDTADSAPEIGGLGPMWCGASQSLDGRRGGGVVCPYENHHNGLRVLGLRRTFLLFDRLSSDRT